jgi:hypothetical protein
MRKIDEENNHIDTIAFVCFTVNKQQSLNLRFSGMFCIESKMVHVGAEKIITLYK